mmetsp:Transcript_2592/g.4719  ORF Transcript_2592/g.4719 Transcript_2592/m.4719 type:complete len:109 (+) Transcript_2592:53-379(+)|eukprot:CAMPEP_0114412782 /NCGR_PEP_ID=MMETSP0103-20121206/509_1 /TAXON_ID=37642 ORGANISM="Paraphysomonas imperforata, Strain PA2" /NCGR_SAMPLE_ID=MMETSP0103 /ASSEMBLY_ACC=CAM_ASM_000201 /LENGTH=108 /DNA_ID=CAMNT_0001580821 /DNA_START=23 /DNA_END=349 /DNA_ORIENTATION=-
MSSTGTRIGDNKGFPVEKRNVPKRPSQKPRLSKRTAMVRELVGEVMGMAPYEKRLLDMLRVSGASADKRMYKVAKRRLGTHKRALKKREQIKETYGKMRAKAAMASGN